MNGRLVKITDKQRELLRFIKEEMPYGQCVLITHEGQPQRVEQINKRKIFGVKKNTSATPVENSTH